MNNKNGPFCLRDPNHGSSWAHEQFEHSQIAAWARASAGSDLSAAPIALYPFVMETPTQCQTKTKWKCQQSQLYQTFCYVLLLLCMTVCTNNSSTRTKMKEIYLSCCMLAPTYLEAFNMVKSFLKKEYSFQDQNVS